MLYTTFHPPASQSLPPKIETLVKKKKTTPSGSYSFGTQTEAATLPDKISAIPSTSKDVVIHETPKQRLIFPETEVDDDNVIEEDAQAFDRENLGPVVSLYVIPYPYNKTNLYTQYGIRKDGDVFKIGDSGVLFATMAISQLKEGTIGDCGYY